jgi:hypothetical protein
MTRVLIDNATISSVQRALGKASIREPSLLDVEHVALARFSEAVLLSNSVVIPDSYKAELTPTRKALLSGDVFEFQALGAGEDEAINEVCADLLPIWREAFRAGSDRSLFSEYFSQVNAFSNFIWEHASSEFFLVFRALGIDKESPLIEAVLATKASDSLGQRLNIIGTDEKVVPWERLSPHVQRMLTVMGWLGHQYLWHQIFSAQHELSYMPHPLRDFFAYDFLSRVNSGAKSTSAFSTAFSSHIGVFQGKVKDSLKALGQAESSITVALPGFLPLLVRESSSREDFLNVLTQMRSETAVIELRELLEQIEDQISKGNYKALSKMKREIEALGRSILIERGLEEGIIKLSPPTTIFGIKVEGDDLSVNLRIPSILYKQFFLRRRYRAFVKRVMDELAIPAQYGELKTKLNGWAWIGKGGESSKFYLREHRPSSIFHKPFDEADEQFEPPTY